MTFNLSDIGEGIHEVAVKEWFVEQGQVVSQFDNICEVQSDKASVTITSRYDGKITKLYYSVDDVALVGKPLVDFEVEDDGIEEQAPPTKTLFGEDLHKDDPEIEQIIDGKKVLTTPSVRRLAKEKHVDLRKVHPTGRGGRILKGDVLEYLDLIPKGTQKPHPTLKNHAKSEFEVPPPLTSRTVISPLEHKVVPLKGVPKVMFRSMTESLVGYRYIYIEDFLSYLVNYFSSFFF